MEVYGVLSIVVGHFDIVFNVAAGRQPGIIFVEKSFK
jgi:hypothetical protein